MRIWARRRHRNKISGRNWRLGWAQPPISCQEQANWPTCPWHSGNLEAGVRVTHRVPSPPVSVQTLCSHSISQLLLQGCPTPSSHSHTRILPGRAHRTERKVGSLPKGDVTYTHTPKDQQQIYTWRMIGQAVSRTESTQLASMLRVPIPAS